MSEEATPIGDVDARIEAVLFPQGEQPSLDEQPKESEQVSLDSDENPIPEDDQSEDTEVKEQEEETPPVDENEALYQHLGIDEEQLSYDDDTGEPVFHAKVGDQDYPVKFKDLVKSYQLDKHINNKSVALSEKQKEFDETYGDFQHKFNEKLGQAEELASVMEKQLLGDFNKIDWDALKAQDPTQYAVQRQDYAEQAQNVKQIQDVLAAERESEQNQQTELMQRKFNEFKAQQAERLIASYPQWLDANVMKKEITDVRTFAMDKYGFSEKELDGIYDSRIIQVLMDAKSLNKAKANVESKTKKAVPKFQKTSGRGKSSESAKAAKAKRAALRKSGSQADLTNVLIDRM